MSRQFYNKRVTFIFYTISGFIFLCQSVSNNFPSYLYLIYVNFKNYIALIYYSFFIESRKKFTFGKLFISHIHNSCFHKTRPLLMEKLVSTILIVISLFCHGYILLCIYYYTSMNREIVDAILLVM